MNEIAAHFGINVRNRRRALAVSQKDLSVLAGLDVATVSHIERGVANPTLETMLRLAVTLECDLGQLVHGVQGSDESST